MKTLQDTDAISGRAYDPSVNLKPGAFSGRRHTNETRKKMSLSQRGRTISKRHRELLRLANLGKTLSAETRSRISSSLQKTKTSRSEKTRKYMIGRAKSLKHKQAISKSLTGKVFTEEHRKNISLSWIGRNTYKRTPESRAKLSASIIKHIQSGNGKRKDTSIELLIRSELEKMGIQFLANIPICGFLVDIYIPQARMVVECDGCYWHCCDQCGVCTKDDKTLKRVTSRDRARDERLIDSGYRVMRFWEHEIKSSAFRCADYIRRNLSSLRQEYTDGIWT